MLEKGQELRERNGKQEVSFKVSAMPLQHFLRFKQFADEEWGSSYWHTIKFLLDWYERTKGLNLEVQDEPSTDDVKFLGE